MEHQQSHEMRVVAWLCEISLTPAWPQYAGIPRPGGRGQSWRCPRKTVSGRGNPRASSFFRPSPYPGPWEVSPLGEGQTGRGQKAPAPVSGFSMSASPTPRWLPLQALPHTLDRGRHLHGGGADGEGAKSPLLCLCFQYAGTSAPVRSRYGLTRNYKGCEEGQTPAKISKDQVTTCKSAVTEQPGGLRGLA